MCNLQWKTMVNLQRQPTTDRFATDLLDEEDERERVLLVVVRAADQLVSYAMNVTAVREVIRARAVTRVPGTPCVMSGLVNVRGMVVTVLDLAACLNADGTAAQATPESPAASAVTETRAQSAGSIVLLEHGGRLVGLAVHGVRDVRPVDDAGLVSEGSVPTESDGIRRGLASVGGEVVTLLDVAALLSRYLISSGET